MLKKMILGICLLTILALGESKGDVSWQLNKNNVLSLSIWLLMI